MRDHTQLRRFAVRVFSVLGLLYLTVHTHPARATAMATSNLRFLAFTFGLTSDESVDRGTVSTFCLPPIGSGSCGKTLRQANFIVAIGPTDPDALKVRIFGSARAVSPPAAFSLYIDGITSILDFSNYSTGLDNIEVTWNGFYVLSAQGAISEAGIAVSYEEMDALTGVVLVPNTSLIPPDSQSNNGAKMATPHGMLDVVILPLSTTELIVRDPQAAFAASISVPIPEPPMAGLLVVGVAGLLCYRCPLPFSGKRPNSRGPPDGRPHPPAAPRTGWRLRFGRRSAIPPPAGRTSGR